VPLLVNRAATVAEGRHLRNFDVLDIALNCVAARSAPSASGERVRVG